MSIYIYLNIGIKDANIEIDFEKESDEIDEEDNLEIGGDVD